MKKINIAIVGVTGLVGRTLLEVLNEYNFNINIIKMFASKKSEGKIIKFKNKEYVCKTIYKGCFKNIDYALFCTNKNVSKKYCIQAEKEGAIVIDNSSYYRMNNDIPLIIPEINIDDFFKSKRKIIANPNCSTIQSVLPIYALTKEYKVKRIIYNTYQSISGAGQTAINSFNKLKNNINDYYFSYDITKTCIPFIDSYVDNDYSNEEMKMINETKKILNNYDLEITATCVRVPVINCHGVSIYIEFDKEYDMNKVKELLNTQKGIKVFDNAKENIYPSSIIATNNDLIYVGRIRKDLNNKKGLLMYVVSDNLRKGASSNVIQIMSQLIHKTL